MLICGCGSTKSSRKFAVVEHLLQFCGCGIEFKFAMPSSGNHAEAQADLSMAIDGKPNTVLIPSLDCILIGSVWTNFTNFWRFFDKPPLG